MSFVCVLSCVLFCVVIDVVLFHQKHDFLNISRNHEIGKKTLLQSSFLGGAAVGFLYSRCVDWNTLSVPAHKVTVTTKGLLKDVTLFGVNSSPISLTTFNSMLYRAGLSHVVSRLFQSWLFLLVLLPHHNLCRGTYFT